MMTTANSWVKIPGISIQNCDLIIRAFSIRSSNSSNASSGIGSMHSCSIKALNNEIYYYTSVTYSNSDILIVEYVKTI